MPKANPFAQVAKRLASLQAKSAKVNEELKALAGIVDSEMKKAVAAPSPAKTVAKATPAKAPVKVAPKAVVAKVAPAKADKTVAAPKRGRPSKK